MRASIRLLRVTTVVSGLALAGCAPSFGGSPFGPGLQLGFGQGGRLSLTPSTCFLLNTQTAEGLISGVSPASQAHARMQQIGSIQSRLMLGSASQAARAESWKRLASGTC